MLPCPEPQYFWEQKTSFLGVGGVPHELMKPSNPRSLLFPFSPPFFYQDFMPDLLSPNPAHDSPPPPPLPLPPPPPPDSSRSAKQSRSCTMRAQRADRHSKIHTVHGFRDRRMRLSKDVARRFFHLHGVLGFDKPSMTLDWLLHKSHYAIGELAGAPRSNNTSAWTNSSESSASSNCKLISSSITSSYQAVTTANGLSKQAVKSVEFRPTFTRESRAMARSRAREKASKKKEKKKKKTTSRDHEEFYAGEFESAPRVDYLKTLMGDEIEMDFFCHGLIQK